MSDNGPQYTSQSLKTFVKEWQFEHITSSPHFPRSNGKAENTVKTLKIMMMKCNMQGEDFYLALFEWRNSPSEGLDHCLL